VVLLMLDHNVKLVSYVLVVALLSLVSVWLQYILVYSPNYKIKIDSLNIRLTFCLLNPGM
jgi:hypothetical protein